MKERPILFSAPMVRALGDAMTCDHVDCEAEAEWSLEVCPMPNDGASVVYACTQHVGDLSDGVTEARGLGKAEQ